METLRSNVESMSTHPGIFMMVGFWASLGAGAAACSAWGMRRWIPTALSPFPLAGLVVTCALVSIGVRVLFGYDPALPAWWWLGVIGVSLGAIDLHCHRLPRTWVLALVAGGVVVFACLTVTGSGGLTPLLRSFGAALLVLAVGAGIYAAAPGWLGFGDVTLLSALAAFWGWLGWRTVLWGLFLSLVVLGVVAAVAWLLGRRGEESRIAAGPSIVLGGWIAIVSYS
ncbi:hypothetical protein [Saccharopolyspora sp. NPDC049426]|uniref:hypothetical protein n=1 Tax=Saccharopolyspora sp. NPDC049426 TaxID=3155652 RepID=UPI00342A6324